MREALLYEVALLVHYGLPVLFVVMLAIPSETDTVEIPQVVDFFYAEIIVLLLSVTVLGSFALMTLGRFIFSSWGSFSASSTWPSSASRSSSSRPMCRRSTRPVRG